MDKYLPISTLSVAGNINRITLAVFLDVYNNNNNNNNNNIYLQQLVCYTVAVAILHVNKHEIGYY